MKILKIRFFRPQAGRRSHLARAVDNVKIQVPSPPADYLDFWVYLDTNFVGVTTDTDWNFAPLMYGQSYTASVAARYSSGLSSRDYYTFTCQYLFPPDSLTAVAPDDAAILTWYPPLEFWPVNPDANRDVGDVLFSFPSPGPISACWGICDDGNNLLGYNVCRDNDFIAFTPHVPPGVYVPQGYVDEGLAPGFYQYKVTAVYDLAEYGFPGETGESMEEGPGVCAGKKFEGFDGAQHLSQCERRRL
jgi:hypothetical protein